MRSEQDGEVRRDNARIIAEITGQDTGTDPFVAAVRATRMPMIVTNPRMPDNPVVFANDAFCRLSGYARSQILGRNCRFLQGPETDRETVRRIRAAVDSAQSIEIDIRNHRQDGTTFWNRLLMAPVKDGRGDLAYFFASQVDVTIERERLEGLESDNAALMAEVADRLLLLQDRERELRFALEAGRFGAWALDFGSGELTTTPTCRRIFGRDPERAFTYEDLRAQVHPDDSDRMGDAVRRSVEEGVDYDIEYRVITPPGETRWIRITGRPVAGPDGRTVRMAGVSLDATEDKRRERIDRAYVDLADRFRDLVDPAEISFAGAEILGRTLGVSRAGYGTIRSDDETIVIERDWTAPGVASLAGTLRFREYGSYIEDLKRGQTVVFADARTDPRTASTAAALESISARSVVNLPLTEQGGLVALLFLNNATARAWHEDELAFVRDVAERTRGAVERRRAEHELALLAASLEQQVADRSRELLSTEEALRQSQKMEAVGQLTGGVAHDFNNLLTVIRSSVDLLQRPGLPDDRRTRYLGAISDTVTRASKLTGQLLAFARRQALKPETFDVAMSLEAIGEMVGALTGSRIVIDLRLPERRYHVHADRAQFDTSLVNIIVNARDAMDGEGRITVAIGHASAIPALDAQPRIPGDFVAVSIADEGVGIGTADLGRIFEPFFTTKEVGHGTGLGLSQVFGFAKQSGGEVRVESEVGRGTTFTLYLPRTQNVPAPPEQLEMPPGTAPADGDGARILVVEDNADVGLFATRSLAELGYETEWVQNAAEALAALDREPDRFDAVFSDVVMPGMSGIELGRELRARWPRLPVILTSGYSQTLAEEGVSGFDFLQKPYSVDQLSILLIRALGRSGATAEA